MVTGEFGRTPKVNRNAGRDHWAPLTTLALSGDRIVAGALLLQRGQHLYGRYWGSDGHYDALHFETCYHQGIEYCIETGKQHFEPGTQGEHKVSRGFLPTLTYSAHWLAHPQFRRAIADFLARETPAVRGYAEELAAHSPYKQPDATCSQVPRPT